MICPHCKVPLLMTDRKGVEIDYCGQCRGVWLDRGELDKIIELSFHDRGSHGSRSSGMLGYDAQAPAHTSGWNDVIQQRKRQSKYHKPYHQYKKKKSLLGDLFDIFD